MDSYTPPILSTYISYLKRNGLATNNLYRIEIGPPPKMLSELANSSIPYIDEGKEQRDQSVSTQGTGLLTGIFDIDQYRRKVQKITSLFSFGGFGSKVSSIHLGNMNKKEMVSLLCTSAQIPFYKQKTGKTFINHMYHKFAVGVDTDPIKLTFYVDRDGAVLEFFKLWNESIYNGGVMSYKDQYAANSFMIRMMNKNTQGQMNDFFYGELIGAYPVYIEPINLTNGNTELIQLNVTFEYDKINHFNVELGGFEADAWINNPLTGISILDMKNKVEQGINNVKDLIRTPVNTIKSAKHTVEDMKNTAKRVLRF